MEHFNAKSNHTFQVTEVVCPESPDSSEISSKINDTSKECCVDPFGNQEELMVVESSSTIAGNISNFNGDDTKFISICKDVAFKKKQISNNIPNASYMFDNIIEDDNSDVSESSICLSRFQKHKKLLAPNNKDFVEINFSENSVRDSTNNSIEPLKFGFSKKNKDQSCFDEPDYSLSSTVSTDGIQVTSEDNISRLEEKQFFKKPFDSFLLVNNSIADISKTTTPKNKSIRKTTEEIDSTFGNFNNELSVTFMSSNNNKTLSDNQVSNINDISPYGNSTQNILHSQSINDKESINTTVGLPINEMYSVDSCLMSQSNSDVSTRSVNDKTLLSDTYIIEKNSNARSTKRRRSSLKNSNNTINTLTDVSNKSKSLVKKLTFLHKLQLVNISQDFNFTINNSDDSILNDDNINYTRDDISKKFKTNKVNHSEDFEVFDNIIFSNQKNEFMTSKSSVINNSTTDTLTAVVETSNTSDLYISSKFIDNTEELTKQSNVILDDGAVENDKFICPTSVSCKSSSFSQSSFKFDIKQFGCHSLSYQEKSMSSSKVVKPHNILLSNSIFNKTFEKESNTFHKSVDNVNLDSNSEICETPKIYESSQKSQQFTVSLPPVFTTTDKEIEENNIELPQNISLMSSQSSESCFTEKHNINSNSEVFSNLIDDSLNNDISLDVSKQIKFKNYKDMSSAHSIMFENIVTSSQESPDSTINQNKIIGQAGLYDQSNIQGKEINVFANSVELLSNNESIDSPVRRLKKPKLTDKSNVEEPRCSKSEMNILNNKIGKSSLNHTKAESSIEQISETSVINTTSQFVQNNSLSSVGSVNNASSSNINADLLKSNNINKSVFYKIPSNNLLKKTSMILEEDSIIHDQASNNSTTNQNSIMTQSALYSDTKNKGDEISMFSNTDELLSYSKFIGFDQNIDTDNTSNSEKSKNSVSELNTLDKTSTDSNSKHFKANLFQRKIFGVPTSNDKLHTDILKQKDISIKHQSLNITNDNSVVSNKPLKLKENINYSCRTSGYLSAKEKQSIDSVESKILNINHINVNVMPIASTSTSNSVVNCNDEDTVFDNDNSLFWTTISKNSMSKSRNVLDVNSENYQLSIVEKIDKIVEHMAVNKLTARHPGAFVLYEYTNQSSTGLFSNHLLSPSILTRALPRHNSFELTFAETSLPNSDINRTEIEEQVQKKYPSLYNKEAWITKRLYNFLVGKFQLRYKILAIKYAEKFVKFLATILKQVYSDKNPDLQLYSDMLRYHMARYGIINTTADYLGFLTDYIPNPYYDRLMPGWNFETSPVKFDEQKYFKTIMEDEVFLNMILEKLNNT